MEEWTQWVTCKGGVMLTLHGTCCVHTFMNLRKNEIHLYIYLLFLHRSCSLFVKFWFKYCKLAAKKSYNPMCLVIMFTTVTMTWCQSNVTLAINYCIYLWHRLRVTGPSKIGSSKEIVGECKYTLMNVRKMKCISYIYILLLHHFCSSSVKFWNKSCKISGKEKLLSKEFGYHIQQLCPWRDMNQTIRRPINYFIYPRNC